MENSKIVTPKKSIAENYIFSMLYRVFVCIAPLITTPYISRVLGANGIGQFSFTNSITIYFTLLAGFGFGTYASREIAYKQGNKAAQSKIFWEIIIARFMSSSISTILFCSLGWCGFYKSYSSLMWWWVLEIVAVEFDITFLFEGNEEFQKIVLRNLIIKILSIALVFVIVKKPEDVWIYIICTSGSTLFGNISLWFYLPKCLVKVKFTELQPWIHFRYSLRLFIPAIATSIYSMLDKTLIGLIIQETYTVQEVQIVDGIEKTVEITKRYADLENGYYEQAEKVVKMSTTIITALGTVMCPRNSMEYANGNIEKVKENVYFATNFVWFIGTPMMFGIAALAPNLVPWFLGDGFEKSILLMQLFTPLILFWGLSNVFGSQYLIPTKRDGKYTIGVLSGTFTNIILDSILIYFYWSTGAVIATLFAEFMVAFTMMLMVRREISIFKVMKQSWKYLISGTIMFLCVYVTQAYLSPTILHTFVLILEGIVIYFVLILIFHDRYSLSLFHLGIEKMKNFFASHFSKEKKTKKE
jgi:O-antigen/teichoic acid export membrane protein